MGTPIGESESARPHYKRASTPTGGKPNSPVSGDLCCGEALTTKVNIDLLPIAVVSIIDCMQRHFDHDEGLTSTPGPKRGKLDAGGSTPLGPSQSGCTLSTPPSVLMVNPHFICIKLILHNACRLNM